MATIPEEEARRLEDEARRLNEETRQEIDQGLKSLNSTAQAADAKIEKAGQEIANNLRPLNSITQAAAASMGTAAKDISDSSQETDARILEAERGFRTLGSSVINFGRALSSNDTSLSKYSGAIESAGDGLAMLATAAFGPLGIVLGFVIKAFTSLMSAELKQTDKILGNFEKLGDLGAAAQMTSEEMEGMFNNAGFSTINGQSQMMVKTITSLGGDLTRLGATSADGIKTFTQLASFNTSSIEEQQKIRNQFANLGYSQEKLLNAQASFMKEQGALGFGKKQVDKKLVDQSLTYTKNLSMLSALTGESADAIKESRKKDLEDFAFNVKLRELGDSEKGQKDRELAISMSQLFKSTVDPRTAKAFRDVYSNTFATTEEAQALALRTGNQFATWTAQFKSGELSPAGFINKLNESGDEALKTLGTALKSNKALQESFGMGVDTVKNTSRHMAENAMESVMDEINKKADEIDPYVNFANITKNLADQFAKMMDELLKLLKPMLIDAFTSLLEATQALIKGLMQSRLAKAFGIDFEPLLLKMQKTGKIAGDVDKLVLELEKEKKNKDTLTGGTPENILKALKDYQIDFRNVNQRIADIEARLKARAKPIYDRDLIYKNNPFDIGSKDQPPPPVKPNNTPAPAAGPMNESAPKNSGNQQQQNSAPKNSGNQQQQNSAPQYKFGGVTGNGFGDMSQQISGGDKVKGVTGNNFGDMSQKISGGGIFEGPTSGYRKTLPKNKNFAVVPLPSGDTIPVSFQGGMDMGAKMPADLTANKTNPLSDMSSISDMMSEFANIFKQNTEESPAMNIDNTSSSKQSNIALGSITDKLDTLLERIRLNNNLQTELLDYARG